MPIPNESIDSQIERSSSEGEKESNDKEWKSQESKTGIDKKIVIDIDTERKNQLAFGSRPLLMVVCELPLFDTLAGDLHVSRNRGITIMR